MSCVLFLLLKTRTSYILLGRGVNSCICVGHPILSDGLKRISFHWNTLIKMRPKMMRIHQHPLKLHVQIRFFKATNRANPSNPPPLSAYMSVQISTRVSASGDWGSLMAFSMGIPGSLWDWYLQFGFLEWPFGHWCFSPNVNAPRHLSTHTENDVWSLEK